MMWITINGKVYAYWRRTGWLIVSDSMTSGTWRIE